MYIHIFICVEIIWFLKTKIWYMMWTWYVFLLRIAYNWFIWFRGRKKNYLWFMNQISKLQLFVHDHSHLWSVWLICHNPSLSASLCIPCPGFSFMDSLTALRMSWGFQAECPKSAGHWKPDSKTTSELSAMTNSKQNPHKSSPFPFFSPKDSYLLKMLKMLVKIHIQKIIKKTGKRSCYDNPVQSQDLWKKTPIP